MSDLYVPAPAFHTPMAAQMIDGEVVITGPGGFSGSFTVDAARESGRRLLAITGDGDAPFQKPLG